MRKGDTLWQKETPAVFTMTTQNSIDNNYNAVCLQTLKTRTLA